MISFELWRGPELVAGEIGCATGCSFTSFSGFFTGNGTGTIQMALTAKVLEAFGFTLWDLGQEHAYKLMHGASMMPRDNFLCEFRRARGQKSGLDEFILGRVGEDGQFHGGDLLKPRL